MVTTRPTTRATTRPTIRSTTRWEPEVDLYEGALLEIPGTLLDSQRMLDASGNSNHLTLTSGRGVTGDGVVGFGLVPSTGLTDVTSFSVVFWINPGTLAAGDTYLARWDTGATKRVWAIKATGTTPTTIAVMTSADGTAESTWTSTANHLVNGTLIQCIWTYSVGTAVLYVNGAAAAGAGDTAATLFGTDIGLSILSSLVSGAVANAASGTVRDVQFYSLVLSAAEAAAMFADPEYRPYAMGAGLELDCRCSSSLAASLTGYPIVDRSGNGRHGVWTGCAGAGSRVGGPQSALESFSSRMWFNGTTQYVTLAAAFSPGTANFYVEFSLFSGNVATGAAQRLFSFEDSDTDGLRIQLSATGVFTAAVNGTTVASGATLVSRTKYRIRFQRVGDLFNFVVNGTPGATTEIVAANIAVTAAARIGARGHTSPSFYANGLIYDIDLNGALIPGTGDQVADWQAGCTVTGSPGRFMVPAIPGGATDAFGDTPNRIRLADTLNIFGELEYAQFAIPVPQGPMTLIAWAKPVVPLAINMFLLSGEDANNDGVAVYANTTLAWLAKVDAVADLGASGSAGAWQQVALVFTGTTVECYVNGVGSGSPEATTLAGTLTNFRVGARAHSLVGSWRGGLAHPAVFPTAKTGAELLAIFNAEKATYGL